MIKQTPPASVRRGAKMLTVPEVADQLDVSQKTVRRRIADRTLPAHRIGGAIRIAVDDLNLFLGRHRV